MNARKLPRWLFASLLVALSANARADEFERAPINYSQATPDNAVSRLQARLEAGETRLEHEDHLGYLRALLRELAVPASSQGLVYSKTSLQRHRISPRTPRAIYFNDDVYVGYCQQGDVMEVSVADPQLGTVYYTLDQHAEASVRLVRQTENCLLCHGGSQTQEVPGHLVRSVYVNASGEPNLAAGTHRTDHTSPFNERWGGWYVTGTHGDQRHLGNLVVREREVRLPVDNVQGQNVIDLTGRFAVDRYLTPHSDIVALMVLEHQTMAHNLLVRANFQTRQALHLEQELNRELGRPLDYRSESTTSRIESACEALADCLLFVDEAPLSARVVGTSDFAAEFVRAGPYDAQGRSLRQFDLERRLFRYPLSYLIYSASFDALPPEARDRVLRRILDVLTGADASSRYAHLTSEDRRAILEILSDTKPGLPEWWRSASPVSP